LKETEYLDDFEVDLHDVMLHYMRREAISTQLRQLLRNSAKKEYVELALGVSDPHANYSANEHQLGPMILENNSINEIFLLAQKLAAADLIVTNLPKTIYQAKLSYLKIGVGSEIAALLQPNRFWIGNTRTIWSHLVIKHKGDWERANEELKLYRFDDPTSEMAYKIWKEIYLSMEPSLEIISRISMIWAEEQNVKPGKQKYIWLDALCNALYEGNMNS